MEETGNWYDAEGIDASLVSDKVKGFSDINGLLKSYNESQSYIGGAVKIPTDKSTDEERSAFYAKLGRPESADKYEWQPPEGISVEGVTDGEFKKFKDLAFVAGLSNKQLGAVMGGWSEIVQSLQAKQAKFLSDQSAATTAELKREWGDEYQQKFDLTMKKLETLGVRKHLEASGILTPEIVKGFYGMISSKEETAMRGATGGGVPPMDEIKRLKESPAYLNASHPDHIKIVQQINGLWAKSKE